MSNVTLHLGDCLEVMRTMPSDSVHSIVCDPPYMLNFMGKAFDRAKDNPAASVEVWAEALRVAKPGAMLLAFGGTRTHHRLMVAIEDAGWEIKDCLMWLHAQGFPKGIAIDKAIDKHFGKERDVIGPNKFVGNNGKANLNTYGTASRPDETAPATPEAAQWQGWHSALKPAWEPIILAMKPLDGTFAHNALKHGVGGLNVDGCRIGTNGESMHGSTRGKMSGAVGSGFGFKAENDALEYHPQGRWPANLLLDESAARLLDEMSGERKSGKASANGHRRKASLNYQSTVNYADRSEDAGQLYGDTGGASRFFYVAKASKRDRSSDGAVNNTHPTCKPTALMKYLCRLVCPPNGTILDPFLGSGTTGVAAKLEGFHFVGIEISEEYLAIARRRIDAAQPEVKAQLPLLELT